MLPELAVVESVVDLAMPDTTGALSVERIWTGHRGALFGIGWETLWDVHLERGTIVGPVPAEPLTRPEPGATVDFADGSSIEFDDGGRPRTICPDAALCTEAEWTQTTLTPVSGRSRRSGEGRTRALSMVAFVRASSADGRSVAYEYEGGYLATVGAADQVLAYSYEGGRLARIDGPTGRTFNYTDGSLSGLVDRDGGRWAFAVAGPGRLQITQPSGSTRSYLFSGRQLIEATDDDLGLLLRRTYSNGALMNEERPREGLTIKRRSAAELEVVQARPLEPSRRSVFTVDELGRVVRNESSDGVASITYDGRSGRPASIANGEAVTRLEYDAMGLLSETSDADGYRVTVQRDRLGQIQQVSDGVLTTRFEYDAAGRATVEESAGRRSTASYDGGLVSSLTAPSGPKLSVTYGTVGTLESVGPGTSEQFRADNNHECCRRGGADGGGRRGRQHRAVGRRCFGVPVRVREHGTIRRVGPTECADGQPP